MVNGAVDAIKLWSGAASWLLGFSVAGALLGSAVGAWFTGPLADRYGRIVVMEIVAMLSLVFVVAKIKETRGLELEEMA